MAEDHLCLERYIQLLPFMHYVLLGKDSSTRITHLDFVVLHVLDQFEQEKHLCDCKHWCQDSEEE